MEQNENLEGKNYTLIEREKNNLTDFLFDYNTSHCKREAAKNFDLVDLVCVVGDASLLPWMKAATQVHTIVVVASHHYFILGSRACKDVLKSEEVALWRWVRNACSGLPLGI